VLCDGQDITAIGVVDDGPGIPDRPSVTEAVRPPVLASLNPARIKTGLVAAVFGAGASPSAT